MSNTQNANALADETYEHMKRLAANYLTNEMATVSLSPTVLVHEAYMRLSKQTQDHYQGRGHFLAIAATMMRRILVDHARSRNRLKRGGDLVRVMFDEESTISTGKDRCTCVGGSTSRPSGTRFKTSQDRGDAILRWNDGP
jgi:RNA polymerase sigma-70 factor, ECF subfamily